MALVVKHAIYGALAGGESYNADAFDVTSGLQTLINGKAGVVAINNGSFGDPAPGNEKHFGAVVARNGQDFFFACDENQTIDFNHGGGVSKPPSLFTVKWCAACERTVSGYEGAGRLHPLEGIEVWDLFFAGGADLCSL